MPCKNSKVPLFILCNIFNNSSLECGVCRCNCKPIRNILKAGFVVKLHFNQSYFRMILRKNHDI